MTFASTKTRAPTKLGRPARHWTAFSLALALGLVVSLLVAPAANAAIVLFTDGFESGSFAAWTWFPFVSFKAWITNSRSTAGINLSLGSLRAQ